ncbi:MAG: hypothetical protein ACJ8GN_07260 [Longimicrobiaceae bacterium]
MKTMRPLSILIAAGAIALTATTARAQKITCTQAQNCNLNVSSETAPQYLTVHVSGSNGVGLRDVPVTFVVKKGSGGVTPEARTDVDGYATTQWTPAAAGAYPAEIQVSATAGGRVINQTLQITYTAPVASVALYPATHSGDHQWWYEENQLRNPLRVEIRGPMTAAECQAAKVIFRSVGGGTAAPDTVNGTWEGRSGEQCVAESWWRLPKGVGTSAVRASMTNGSNVSFLAHGRRLPRIMAGVAGDMSHSFTQAKTSTRTIQVSRVDPVQNTTITYDSTITTAPRVDTTHAKFTFTPTIGVDFPLNPRLQWARGSILTTLRNPEKNLFVGLSLWQILRGVAQEGVGFDVHAMVHLQRVETLRDPVECRDAGKCGTDTVNRYSLGIVGIASASEVLSNLTAVFGIK